MKKRTRAIIAGLTLCLMLPFMAVPASATKAHIPEISYGDTSSGLISVPYNDLVVLESIRVSFNIIDYPEYEYENPEDFKQYKSTVTTEYSFVNSTDEKQALTLAMPVSMRCDYGEIDTSRFELMVNGEKRDGEKKYSIDDGYYSSLYGELLDPNDLQHDTKTYNTWYVYQIELNPKEQISVTQTTPVYPDINQDYEPQTYDYSYTYNSPNTSTKKAVSVDFTVNCDYYMLENDHFSFTETDSGYTLHFDDLNHPGDGAYHGGIDFSLCSIEDPLSYSERSTKSLFKFIGIIILLAPIILIVRIIYQIIVFVVKIIYTVINFVIDTVASVIRR